jgi:hypothetical protein
VEPHICTFSFPVIEEMRIELLCSCSFFFLSLLLLNEPLFPGTNILSLMYMGESSCSSMFHLNCWPFPRRFAKQLFTTHDSKWIVLHGSFFFNSERTKHEQINLHCAAVEKFPLFFLVFLPRLSLSRGCLAKINRDPEWYQSISFLQGCLA